MVPINSYGDPIVPFPVTVTVGVEFIIVSEPSAAGSLTALII